jgi:hypothetical protein
MVWFRLLLHFIVWSNLSIPQNVTYIEKVGSKWGLSAHSHGVKLPLKPGDAEKIMALPIPSIPNQAVVSSYAKLCGELMFVGINTMPTIIYSIHLLAGFMTNATKGHLEYAKTVLRYVYSNRHRSITYCASHSTTLARSQRGKFDRTLQAFCQPYLI